MIGSLRASGDGSRRPLFGIILLGLLLLGLIGVGVERCLVSEEERIAAAVEALITAVETEDRAGVDAALLDPFDFSGPNPIRAGERPEMFVSLQRLWDVADDLAYIDRAPEIRIAQKSASHTSDGLIRFKWNDSLVAHRAKIEITLLKGAPGVDDPEAWKIRRIDVLELRRGVF